MATIENADYLAMTYERRCQIISDSPEAFDLPEEASYVAQYLANYRPIDPPENHPDNESSLDIQDTLECTCQVEINLISRIMRMLGYKLYFCGVSQPTWAMKHIESK